MEYITKVLVPKYNNFDKRVKTMMLFDLIEPDSKIEIGYINYVTPFGREVFEEYFIASILNKDSMFDYIKDLGFDIFDISILHKIKGDE